MQTSKFNNYLTDKEKETIIEMYNKGYSTVMIAKELDRSDSSIGRFLKKNGFERQNHKNGLLNEEIEDITQLYQSGKTAREILEKYSHKIKCENTIINIVERNGIKSRPRGVTTYFDKEYFRTIDTEAKAYYLGLLLTDGNVFKMKRKTDQYKIQLSLKYDDVDVVQKFKEELGATTKISHYNKNGRNECTFSVHSKEMAHDLSKYGLHERKTFEAELTNLVPKELYTHYIRGIFDGDGTVYIRSKTNQLVFGFYGTHKLVSQVKQYLIEQIGIRDNSIYDKDTVSFVTFTRKQDVINFYNLIYSNSHFYLDRKKEVFEKYFQIKNIIL